MGSGASTASGEDDQQQVQQVGKPLEFGLLQEEIEFSTKEILLWIEKHHALSQLEWGKQLTKRLVESGKL